MMSEMLLMPESLSHLVGGERLDARLAEPSLHPPPPPHPTPPPQHTPTLWCWRTPPLPLYLRATHTKRMGCDGAEKNPNNN